MYENKIYVNNNIRKLWFMKMIVHVNKMYENDNIWKNNIWNWKYMKILIIANNDISK